ncbi:hypothetical protein FRC09_002288 [Ceratobasidium sp. 395]|nr:hypothetical protein FRC09_002288 [Ceratobasidium sp. 395]
MDEAWDLPLPPVDIVEHAFPGTFNCTICERDDLELRYLMRPASCASWGLQTMGHMYCRDCVVGFTLERPGEPPTCFTCNRAGSWATAQTTIRVQPASNQQAEHDELQARVDEHRKSIAKASAQIERLRAMKKAKIEEEQQLTNEVNDYVDRHLVRAERGTKSRGSGSGQ